MAALEPGLLQIWQTLARNARRRLSLGSLKSVLDVSPERERVSPTAWLNGMRGLAALFVFFYHFAYAYFPWLPLGFASRDEDYHIIQLPFLRLLISGPSMVAIFFLVSGYSLSIGPLKELQNGSSSKCLDRTASAIFRRPIRLFLPSIASTFIVMICVSLGMYTKGDAMRDGENQPGFREPNPQIRVNLWEQFWDWERETAQWLMIWRFDHGNHSYDCHLWTLPVEFRCSIILFVTIAAVANSRARARLLVLLSMVVYCHLSNFWEGWLFFAGSLLAQIKLLQSPPPQLPSMPRKWYQEWKGYGTVLLFLLGLFLLSAPDYNGGDSPGYRALFKLNPGWGEGWRFWYCIGAVLLAWTVGGAEYLQDIFTHPISQYLGRISYALYLVHGPICHMLGFWLIPYMWGFTGKETAAQFGAGFFLGALFVVPITVLTAHVFCQYVDEPSIHFAKRVEASARKEP
ncbi:MAG: hypothetical protein M1840_008711 [Geoglossum simile]|nr:MAG: hypothetical protein M1840_008711 [Geoglossum simile]